MKDNFKALVIRKVSRGEFTCAVEARSVVDLPVNDLLIKVHYSSLNSKDCLSYLGNPAVTRKFPHSPGIDAAGVVVHSKNKAFKIGDHVCVVSSQLGMNVPGGFGQYISVPAEWAHAIPDGMTLRQSMIFGTAGYTAALAVSEIIKFIEPFSGIKIAVSGATGGVGILSVALLSNMGFDVTAISGKQYATNLLETAGASEIISRDAVDDLSGRNLLPVAWSGAIDTVGGNILTTLLKSVSHEGTVVSTGIVKSQELNTSLLPFILRGVRLIGINAEGKDPVCKGKTWDDMRDSIMPDVLEMLCTEVSINEIEDAIKLMLAGKHIGRTIINMNT
jgi:alcohol dehydrogenase